MSRVTRVPALPSPTKDNLLDVAKALKSMLDVREGLAGDPLDANVTFRDLADAGVVAVNQGFSGGGGSKLVMPPWSEPDGYDPTQDFTIPPKPTGFTAVSGFSSIYLEWDGAPIRNLGYTEIWRSSDNVIGNAVRIGTTLANTFADAVGKTSQVYYYWIRFVSVADVSGPYNSTDGTMSGTGLIGGVDLSPLIITADKIASGAIDLGGNKITGLLANANMAVIADPTKIADSLIGNSKLADLAVDAAKLADSAVTATKIANLAVGTAAIQTGAITTALIANAAIGSAQIANAAITSAKIADLAVGSAAIQNAAITNAKIADLAADKITAGSLTAAIGVTTGRISGGVNTTYTPGTSNFGTGFYLGLDSSVFKFYVGSFSNNMLWNGSQLSIKGTISATGATFQGLTVTDSSGNILLSSGGVTSTALAGAGLGSLAYQSSVSSGQVSGLGNFATLSQITAANISTYIAAAAIGGAYIGTAAIGTANIQDAAITNAKVASASIDSAKIADAAITTAKIGDASVSTLKIANQAVTFPQSVYTNAFTDGTSEIDVQTLWVSATGSPALIIFGAHVYSSTHENLYFRLTRDGSTIFQVGPGPDYNKKVRGEGMETATIIDNPGAGSHVYKLYVGSSGAYVSSQSRCISYVEVKR